MKLKKSLKSTHLIVRLNAVIEEKSTVSLGRETSDSCVDLTLFILYYY